jgi:hypothetical protein
VCHSFIRQSSIESIVNQIMKLITFLNKDKESRIGWLQGESVVDMRLASDKLPTDMLTFIDNHMEYFQIIRDLGEIEPHYSLEEVKLLAP